LRLLRRESSAKCCELTWPLHPLTLALRRPYAWSASQQIGIACNLLPSVLTCSVVTMSCVGHPNGMLSREVQAGCGVDVARRVHRFAGMRGCAWLTCGACSANARRDGDVLAVWCVHRSGSCASAARDCAALKCTPMYPGCSRCGAVASCCNIHIEQV